MQCLEVAFEPLAGTTNDIFQICPNNFLSGSKTAVSLSVHQFLRAICIPNPSFQIIKHTKSFIDITHMEQAIGFMTKSITNLITIDMDHCSHAGQDQRLSIIVFYVQMGNIVDFISFQNLSNGITV